MLIGISGKINSGKDTFGDLLRYQFYLHRMSAFSKMTDYDIHLLTDQENPSFLRWGLKSETAKNVGSKVEIRKFATALRKVAEVLTGIPAHRFEEREVKESLAPAIWNRTISDAKAVLHTQFCFPTCTASDEYIITEAMKYGFKVERTYREILQEIGTNALRNGLHQNVWVNALLGQYQLKPTLPAGDAKWPDWIITDVRFPNEADTILAQGGILIRINSGAGSSDHISETALDNYDKFDYYIDNKNKLDPSVTPKDSLQSFANDAMAIVNHLKLYEYAGTNKRPEFPKARSERSPE